MEKIYPDMWIFIQIRGNNGMVLFSSSLSPSNNKMDPQQSISSSGVCCFDQSGSSTVYVWPIGAMNTPVAILPASLSVMHVCGEFWFFRVTVIARSHENVTWFSSGWFNLKIQTLKPANVVCPYHIFAKRIRAQHVKVSMLYVKFCEQWNDILSL